jgi:hypothetical protein
MLRRIIQRSPFPRFLSLAATYFSAVTSGVVLVADALARAPAIWP